MWISRDNFPGNSKCKIWHKEPNYIDGVYSIPPKNNDAIPDEAEYWADIKGTSRSHPRFIGVGVGALMALRPDLKLKLGGLIEIIT